MIDAERARKPTLLCFSFEVHSKINLRTQTHTQTYTHIHTHTKNTHISNGNVRMKVARSHHKKPSYHLQENKMRRKKLACNYNLMTWNCKVSFAFQRAVNVFAKKSIVLKHKKCFDEEHINQSQTFGQTILLTHCETIASNIRDILFKINRI